MHNGHPSEPFLPALRHILGPMGRRTERTLRQVRPATLAQIEDRFGPALPAHLFHKRPSRYHSRERVYTLVRTFWCWIWQVLQANTSCRAVVRQLQALFAIEEGPKVDEQTGAYCVARRKLLLPWLKKIFTASFHSAEACAAKTQLLQARPLRAVDGSGCRLQDTPQNRKAFPPSKNLPKGVGFPYLRIVALFSAWSGAILARATGSLQNAELELFIGLMSHLKKGDIAIGDRAYGIYVIAALLQLVGIDLIARLNACRRVDFRKATQKLGPRDGLFIWKKPSRPSLLMTLEKWLGLPEELTVRIIRVHLHHKGFRSQKLTIVTTLLDAQLYPAEEILLAYAKRWRMEMCLDDLKTTLGMEQLSCRTPAMVQRELLIFLTAHNLLRWVMAHAAEHEEVQLERISFKGTLDAFREWTQAIAKVGRSPRHKRKRAKLWEQFLTTLAADLVPERPGRREPRAVKKRSKYPTLKKPRHQYVDRWSRNKRRRVARAKKQNALI